MKTSHSTYKLLTIAALAFVLTACGSDDDPTPTPTPTPMPTPEPTPTPVTMVTYGYSVKVINLTNAQPMSPVAVVLHGDGYAPFMVGAPASVALETLAESGANADLLTEADANAAVMASASGAGVIGGGAMESIAIETTMPEGTMPAMELSLVTMLVNTNDAITGITGVDVSNLAMGDSMSMMLTSYDAGTEANTESADTIPGPAGAGGAQEAFNAARDDVIDKVLAHPGAITYDDGLATSALNANHKWDNPVIRIMITRTQ